MKKIEAIIRHSKLTEVKDVLAARAISAMTITEVHGFGRQKGHLDMLFRGNEYSVDFVPKIKVEIVVADNFLPTVLQIITQTARTGAIGDGKIFVSDIETAYRIRTGESNEAAV